MPRYAILLPLEPARVGDTFTAGTLPLHVTIVGNFRTDLSMEQLACTLRMTEVPLAPRAEIGDEAMFGPNADILVNLVADGAELERMHHTLLDALGSDIRLDDPHHSRSGYRPHVTVTARGRTRVGDVVTLSHIAMLDLEPNGDTTSRRVVWTHPGAGFSTRPTTEDDWQEVRDLRLEMLRDSPLAFAEHHDDALGHGESEWRMRARRGFAEHGIALVAVSDSGQWIGSMGGAVLDRKLGAFLLGVYVAPPYRGSRIGVTDALLAGIEEWARTEGDTLALHVHEQNSRAISAYLHRGFVDMGERVPYNLDPATNEIVMVKRL